MIRIWIICGHKTFCVSSIIENQWFLCPEPDHSKTHCLLMIRMWIMCGHKTSCVCVFAFCGYKTVLRFCVFLWVSDDPDLDVKKALVFDYNWQTVFFDDQDSDNWKTNSFLMIPPNHKTTGLQKVVWVSGGEPQNHNITNSFVEPPVSVGCARPEGWSVTKIVVFLLLRIWIIEKPIVFVLGFGSFKNMCFFWWSGSGLFVATKVFVCLFLVCFVVTKLFVVLRVFVAFWWSGFGYLQNRCFLMIRWKTYVFLMIQIWVIEK